MGAEIMIKLKDLLMEKTVRLSLHKDANFEPGQFVQLLGKRGMVKLDKKSVKTLAKWIRSNSGKHGMGWSFTEGKLTEGISVADTRFVGKFVIHILSSGREMRSAILSKKNAVKYATKSQQDVNSLWDLAGKYKGKEIKEGKLNEGKTLTLPNGVKAKIDFNGITFIGGRGKPVFLDRGELHKFFQATTKYLRYT